MQLEMEGSNLFKDIHCFYLWKAEDLKIKDSRLKNYDIIAYRIDIVVHFWRFIEF